MMVSKSGITASLFFVNLRIVYPRITEIIEPIKIPILAESIYNGLSTKAKLPIKIDRVNPIPAKKAKPTMCCGLRSLGISIILSLWARKTMVVIPTPFPITRHITKVPIIALFNVISPLRTTPAFAKAETGIIR